MQFSSGCIPLPHASAIVVLVVLALTGSSNSLLHAQPMRPQPIASDPNGGLSDRSVNRSRSSCSLAQPRQVSVLVPKKPMEVLVSKPRRSTSEAADRKQSKRSKSKSGWVQPQTIVDALEDLKTIPVTREWATQTLQLLTLLTEESDVRSFESGVLLGQLDEKRTELLQLVAIIEQRFPDLASSQVLTSRLHRLAYDMEKRLAVWIPLQRMATVASMTDQDPAFQLASSRKLSFDHLDDGWKQFLHLDELERVSRSLKPDRGQHQEVARKALGRIYSPSLDDAQAAYLQQVLDPSTIAEIRQLASGEVNQHKLIKAIEWHDRQPSGVAANYINNQFQNLLWSDSEIDRQTAAQIQAHYRNANFRLTVSRDILNQLIPPTPAMDQPVRDRVLGANVHGQSRIQNRLSVNLIPDPERLHLQLQTDGHVDSDTVATRSGFAVRNTGLARFQAFKRLAIDRFGKVEGHQPTAQAQSSQRLVNIKSKLDPFPVVNWIARRIAQKKVAEGAPQTASYTEKKIEDSAIEQLESGVDEKLMLMQAWLRTNLYNPLVAMDLDPEALQMATTNRRLVMRYRLAGIDQMAANTARPVDSESDYLGIQLHQSLLNNMVERIEIHSREFTPQTLLQHLSDVIGFKNEEAMAEANKDANFEFANYDAIRIDLQDEKICIEMNLKSLQVGKGKKWRNITIASTYLPVVQGEKINLVQDGMVRVKGKGFRLGDQIAVRAIFTVLLPKSYSFDAVPQRLQQNLNGARLEVAKLQIADGWLGLTYDQATGDPGTGFMFENVSEYQTQQSWR